MAFFEGDQVSALSIERMVFHLVGPRPEDMVWLEEINPGRFSDFFIDRIRSVNNGLPYVFSDASATRERLRRIATDSKHFQTESEKLAEDFQRLHGGSAAAGAFLLFQLAAAGAQFFALLKYDDEKVLTYELAEGRGGRKKVSLDALERTFVQNRDALQKSALVKLTEAGGELTVLDRRNQQNVARYFENFLDAVRQFDDAEATRKMVDVTRQVIRENRDLVSPQVYQEVTKRTFDAASAGGQVGVDDQKSFLDTVVGQALPPDHPLVAKFQSALRKQRLDGTPIKFDVSNVRPPSTLRYRTKNGIQIRVPSELKKVVTVEANRIIINDPLDVSYDDTDTRL
ncbi:MULTISPECIES: nucleoid-associated protein [Phyllobacteriaceae]|nr:MULTISPECIES: nucleoid-associated protein [Mesorhizobium]MBN9236899.1 nucleoid-associated protein [Mesorhizobium sp.]